MTRRDQRRVAGRMAGWDRTRWLVARQPDFPSRSLTRFSPPSSALLSGPGWLARSLARSLTYSLTRSLARSLDRSLFFARWFIIPLRSASCELSSRATLLARARSLLLTFPRSPHRNPIYITCVVTHRFLCDSLARSPPPHTEGCGGGFSSLTISSSDDVPHREHCTDATRGMS